MGQTDGHKNSIQEVNKKYGEPNPAVVMQDNLFSAMLEKISESMIIWYRQRVLYMVYSIL